MKCLSEAVPPKDTINAKYFRCPHETSSSNIIWNKSSSSIPEHPRLFMKPHFPLCHFVKEIARQASDRRIHWTCKRIWNVYMLRHRVGHFHHQDFSPEKQQAKRQHDIGYHELKSDLRNPNSENILADFSIFPRKKSDQITRTSHCINASSGTAREVE